MLILRARILTIQMGVMVGPICQIVSIWSKLAGMYYIVKRLDDKIFIFFSDFAENCYRTVTDTYIPCRHQLRHIVIISLYTHIFRLQSSHNFSLMSIKLKWDTQIKFCRTIQVYVFLIHTLKLFIGVILRHWSPLNIYQYELYFKTILVRIT